MTDCDTPRARRLGDAIEAFLEHRAGGRAPGDSVLDEHPTLREWLSPMLAPATDDPVDSTDQGLDLLGDFRLVRERGRGGMGVVFEAIQQSLGRRVALKVLAAERTGSPRSIERFRREASATAKLRHPSIVQVFGVGELAGRHVIAMEFVDGPNLAERLEQQRALPLAQRRIAGDDDERSHVVQVAELVARLADALAYAHEHGVVHRDVKPHNVLLQRDGTPKLVDFGVAKDVDAISLSHTRELIGTPHYMSPEQAARGEATDPRSDVFSLGVVLYELLSFTRPFDGATADQVLAAIRQQDPELLRSRDARIPVELELICGRALEKLPAERYASAAALAADLRSFLRHEPISVHPPGPVTRVRKFARRHRWPLTVGAVLVVGLGAALALATEWRRAGVDAERVQTRRAERFAFEAVDKVLELLAEQLPRTPPTDVDGRARIHEAVQLYETYLEDAVSQPSLRLAVARASVRVGAVYRELGLLAEAAAGYARAVDLWRSLVDEQPDVDPLRTALADAYRAQMVVAQQALDADAARVAYEADLRTREAILARDPTNEDALIGLGQTHTDRGRGILFGPGSLAEARVALERADAIWTRLADRLAGDADLRLCALQVRAGLAFAEQRAGRPRAARRAFEAVLAAVTADGAAGEAGGTRWRSQIAECEHGLGMSLQHDGDPDGAVEHLRRALALQDQLRVELPGRPDVRQRCMSTRALLGGLLLDSGQRAAARGELELALGDARALLEETRGSARAVLQFASLCNRLTATWFEHDSAPDDAVFALYHEALEVLEAARGNSDDSAAVLSSLGATRANLAAAHLMRDELDEALEDVDRAVTAQRAAVDADPERAESTSFLRRHHLLRAQILLRLDDLDAAVRAVEESVTWTVDPRALGPVAVVLDQCADASPDPAVATGLRARAQDLRDRANAASTGR